MSLRLMANQAMRAPLASAVRPTTSLVTRTYTSSTTSTSVTEIKREVDLQAEIISGAPGESTSLFLHLFLFLFLFLLPSLPICFSLLGILYPILHVMEISPITHQ